jgi:hypothetical protein
MLDSEIALEITVSSIRATGNLYPKRDNPIETQMKLGDLRIKGEPRIEEVKVRIIKQLGNLKPVPYTIDKDAFRDIDESTTVGELAAIVTQADSAN